MGPMPTSFDNGNDPHPTPGQRPLPIRTNLCRLERLGSIARLLAQSGAHGYVIQRSGDGAAQLFDFRWLAIPTAALILPRKSPPKPNDCSYKAPFTDSYQDLNDRA
jgi:hypothetical protein